MNNKGGHLPDVFVSLHFTKTGERSAKSRRWHMRCNHCPATAPLIEHRDVRCIKLLRQSTISTWEDYDSGVTMEEIDAEFDKLDDQVFAPADGDGLNPGVPLNEVYDLSELENIRAGTVIATVDEELDLSKEKDAGGEIWDETSLLRSLGVGN
jgi:hypothetical protein